MLECYTIKDKKVGIFQSPYFVNSVVDALRSLTMAANNPDSNLARFSEDFALYHNGKLDEKTGILTPSVDGPQFVTEVSELKNKGKNNVKS